MERGDVELFHPLAGHVEPLVVGVHVVGYHEVPLVGHLQVVQGGPTNGSHVSGVDCLQLHVQGKCGEVGVHIGMKTQQRGRKLSPQEQGYAYN